MLHRPLISFQRFAIAMCLSASGIGVNSAFAQRYYATSSTPAYTQVTPPTYRKPLWPEPGLQPNLRSTTMPAAYAPVPQPMVTYIQTASASVPVYAPPPAPSAIPQEPWVGAPITVSPPSASPIYYSSPAAPSYSEPYDDQPCDWLCQSKKALRGLYRASHRRSDCHFEYPVATPSGSPYGYVEPTWNEFGMEAPAYPIGTGY